MHKLYDFVSVRQLDHSCPDLGIMNQFINYQEFMAQLFNEQGE